MLLTRLPHVCLQIKTPDFENWTDFRARLQISEDAVREVQELCKNVVEEPEKNWLNHSLSGVLEYMSASSADEDDSDDDESNAQAAGETVSCHEAIANQVLLIQEKAKSEGRTLNPQEKKQIFNIKRLLETYKRKDEALSTYSSWLRLIESDDSPQGQWYCMHCHNNPTLRHPKDKLATMKTSVSKYGNLKLHENSACHKAVMDAIEQKTSGNAMPKHITVTPVSAGCQ